jgi:hypothetical protein
LVCEKGIFEVEVISNLSVPQNNKTISTQKPQIVLEKTWMYCTNCHRTNHNVETCKIKRKEKSIIVVSKVTTQQIKV